MATGEELRPTDAEGITHSAGGVPFRRTESGIQFALVRSHTGNWVLPKGGVEPGETVEQAAVREIAEETGLDTKLTQNLGDVRYHFMVGERRLDKEVSHYLARVVGGCLRHDPVEHVASAWFGSEEAVKVARYPNEIRMIERAVAALRRLAGAT